MVATEQARKERIKSAVAGLAPGHETHRVNFQEALRLLPVIRLELSSTVLNPQSHRIKAQLESHPEAQKAIALDPESEKSQSFISDLLRETSGFEALKNNLEAENQITPGIVTLNGRLVNANTRAVALADLGVKYIEVAVLPKATIGEVYDLELDLQVAEDFRQQYSFTNELLFVDDLIETRKFNQDEVARRLRWTKPSVAGGVKRVQRYVRHLTLIREIQAMSGGNVPLTDFDDSEQALQELDTQYEKLRSRNPIAADQLKQARTLGLLVNLGYERQRQIDADWVETHLADALSENDLLGELVESLAAATPDGEEVDATPDGEAVDAVTGLDDFDDIDRPADGKEAEQSHRVVRVLVDRLGKSARSQTVALPTADGDKDYDRESVREALNDAMRTAAEDAKAAAKAGNALRVPAQLADNAANSLKKAQKALAKVKSDSGFDKAEVETKLAQVKLALDAINIVLGK